MNELNVAIKAAKEAGKIILKYYKKANKVIQKGPRDFVSEADFASEKKIIDIIKKYFPNHAIVSEEAGRIGKSDHEWHVDPLDGTHNFLHKTPFFSVSVAYAYKKEVIAGVIYLPVVGEIYYAEKGKGAFLNGKKIKVSNRKNLNESMIMFDGALHKESNKKFNLLKALAKECFRIRIIGAATYHHLAVAIGGAECYIEMSNHSWDNAAGALLVMEAGGKITDTDGKKWDVECGRFVASNGKVHDRILELISKHYI